MWTNFISTGFLTVSLDLLEPTPSTLETKKGYNMSQADLVPLKPIPIKDRVSA
jgi:hypothetical protein